MRAAPDTDRLGVLRAVDRQARELGNLVLALEQIVQAWPGADPELRFHLRRMARWIGARLRPDHDPAGLPARLGWPAALGSMLAEASGEAQQAGVAIEAPLLDVDISGEAFLVRLVVDDDPSSSPPVAVSVEAALDRARRLVFRRLADLGLRLDAERLGASRVRFEGPTARTLHVDGGSIAAAAAAALFARWTDRPLPGGLVITGGLDERGAITPVDGVAAKIAAALRERPQGRVLVPGEQRPGDLRVRGVSTLGGLLRELFGDDALDAGARVGSLDVEGTVRIGVELYEKRGSFALACEVLQVALDGIASARARRGEPTLHRTEELVALWRAASGLVHLGDLAGAQALFARALPLAELLWERGELDPRVYFGLRGNLAVLLRDRFEYEAAEALLLESLAQQRALRQDRREVAKTLGNLGELYTFIGRFDEAEARLDEALEAVRRTYPDEVPRELCYLGNLHLRRGEPVHALGCYVEGLEQNRQVSLGRVRNEAFLRYGLVRAHRRLDEAERVEQQAARVLGLLPASELYPRQLALKERGLARLAQGRWEAGAADLEAAADTTFARGALAELAAGTALGELALALVARGEPGEAAAQARRFRGSGGELFNRLCPPELRLDLDRSLSEPADGPALAASLRATLDRFPY